MEIHRCIKRNFMAFATMGAFHFSINLRTVGTLSTLGPEANLPGNHRNATVK